MDPLFSFIIPVYNTEKYLARCLDSVLAQTCKDFEVIIVDDCSPGDTKKIIDGYDSRLRYIRHDKNRSILQARLTGVAEARGKYIVPVNATDYIAPDLLKAFQNEIIDAGNLDVIVCQMIIDNSGEKAPVWHNHAFHRCTCRDMLDTLFAEKMVWLVCGKCIRTEIYQKAVVELGLNRDFYLNSSEDICQILPILVTGQHAAFIEYPGYYYLPNEKSMFVNAKSGRQIIAIAEEDHRSLAKVTDFLIRVGMDCDMRKKVHELKIKKIRRLLERIQADTDFEWNRCINTLCRIYGTKFVLEQAIVVTDDFFERYKPDCDLFPVCDGPICRIGVLCHRGSGGGAERATMLWIEHMRRLGFHVVWLPDRDFEAKERFALDRDPVKRAEQLQSYINSEHLDLVQLVDHWRMQVFPDLLHAKMAGVRVVIAEHNAYFYPLDEVTPMMYLMRIKLYPLADVVTVLSAENVAWWHSVGLHNVVQMPNFLTCGDDFLNRRPRMDPKGRFLCVGRICNRKNQRDVVAAFAKYLENDAFSASSRLVFLGRFESAEVEADLRSLTKRLGIESKVEFRGEVSDVLSYYQNSDVLIMASRLEGAPMVINEAKSYGLPTVMYELPYVEGTGEVDGVISVPMYDVLAMANAMQRCIVDRKWYTHLSSAAIESLNRYSGDTIETRWRKVFAILETAGSHCDELESFCSRMPGQHMFQTTMKALTALMPALCVQQKVFNATVRERDKVYVEKAAAWKAHDAVAADRDATYQKLAEIWKAHDRIEQERNELRNSLHAERVRQKAIEQERDAAMQSLKSAAQKTAALQLELDAIRTSRLYKVYRFIKSFSHKG